MGIKGFLPHYGLTKTRELKQGWFGERKFCGTLKCFNITILERRYEFLIFNIWKKKIFFNDINSKRLKWRSFFPRYIFIKLKSVSNITSRQKSYAIIRVVLINLGHALHRYRPTMVRKQKFQYTFLNVFGCAKSESGFIIGLSRQVFKISLPKCSKKAVYLTSSSYITSPDNYFQNIV